VPSVFLHPRGGCGSLELGGARLATPCGARMISSFMLSHVLRAHTLTNTILIPISARPSGSGGARHADTHAQSRNTHGARGLKMRRSPDAHKASETDRPECTKKAPSSPIAVAGSQNATRNTITLTISRTSNQLSWRPRPLQGEGAPRRYTS
jgi:hypothetical protein